MLKGPFWAQHSLQRDLCYGFAYSPVGKTAKESHDIELG